MNRTIPVRRALLAGVSVAALLLAASCADGAGTNHDGIDTPGTAQPTAGSTYGAAHNDVDVAFAQMMIPHHQQAVDMATLAATRASDPQLKQIAASIRAAQSPEIATMTGWLSAWGVPTAQPGGHTMPGMSSTEGMPGMMSEAEMSRLMAASGTEFDRMFTRMMIAHHNGAIQDAREERANGSDPTAKALAATIEQAQTAEVVTLQAILDRL